MRFAARRVSLALACAALLGAFSSLAAAECKLLKVGAWTVNPKDGVLVVDGAVNGTKVGVALDTGAAATWISGSQADRLQLVRREPTLYALPSRAELPMYTTSIDELRVGDSTTRNWATLIVSTPDKQDYAVVLGYDFFRQVDVEFDLAHDLVRLFQPRDCGAASLAYWAPRDALQVALEKDDLRPAMLVTVKLNGKPALAALSSGFRQSILSDSLVRQLGLARQASGQEATIALETFAIGDERVRNPVLNAGNLEANDASTYGTARIRTAPRDMFLGLDFLRAHRVLVSHSQGRIYFTYTGGRVFETPR